MHLPLTNNVIAQLYQQHYVIIDDFLTVEVSNELLQDAENLYSQGKFAQHYFQFGKSLLKKPNVFELDLSEPEKNDRYEIGSWRSISNEIGPMFVGKMDELDRSCKLFNVTRSSQQFQVSPFDLDTNSPPAIKVQINTGGGSFPWHYDNPGLPNKRSLTCIVYLNPCWSEGDGGEIILWPFLEKQITIAPLHTRAVLFYSDRILHRVLPSNTRRVCFTMWCTGRKVNQKDHVFLTKDHLKFNSYDEAQAFFASSPLQRVISRSVYDEEYLQSLLECLVLGGTRIDSNLCKIATDEEKNLIKQHQTSVMDIMLKLKPLIEELRKRKVA